MLVIVAGSRYITDYEFVKRCIQTSGIPVSQIISGGARGVDSLAEKYANEFRIPCQIVPADWNKYGKAAGMVRNKLMAKLGEALIAIKITTDICAGTQNMIECAQARELPIIEFLYDPVNK